VWPAEESQKKKKKKKKIKAVAGRKGKTEERIGLEPGTS